MKPVRIGLLGLGTVGGGTVNVLRRNNEEITRRAGRAVHVIQASVHDLNKQRICNTDGIELTTDSEAVVCNPDVEVDDFFLFNQIMQLLAVLPVGYGVQEV